MNEDEDTTYLEMNPNQWVYEQLKQSWAAMEFATSISVSSSDLWYMRRIEDDLVSFGISEGEIRALDAQVDAALKEYEAQLKAECMKDCPLCGDCDSCIWFPRKEAGLEA